MLKEKGMSDTQKAPAPATTIQPTATVVTNKKAVDPTPVVMVPSKTVSEDDNARLESKRKAYAPKEKKTDQDKAMAKLKLSPRVVAVLLDEHKTADAGFRIEIEDFFDQIGLKESDLDAIRADLKANPKNYFKGAQPVSNLLQLGLPPGIQMPPAFYTAPGIPVKMDRAYYPYRFSVLPSQDQWEDLFEEGSLIYHVFEDNSYFVLSPAQQTKEWQSANHLPTANLFAPVGDIESSDDLVQPETEVVVK
jgi:hypothetical protein